MSRAKAGWLKISKPSGWPQGLFWEKPALLKSHNGLINIWIGK